MVVIPALAATRFAQIMALATMALAYVTSLKATRVPNAMFLVAQDPTLPLRL